MPDQKPQDAEKIEVEQPKVPPCDIYAVVTYTKPPHPWECSYTFASRDVAEAYMKSLAMPGRCRLFRLSDSPPPVAEREVTWEEGVGVWVGEPLSLVATFKYDEHARRFARENYGTTVRWEVRSLSATPREEKPGVCPKCGYRLTLHLHAGLYEACPECAKPTPAKAGEFSPSRSESASSSAGKVTVMVPVDEKDREIARLKAFIGCRDIEEKGVLAVGQSLLDKDREIAALKHSVADWHSVADARSAEINRLISQNDELTRGTEALIKELDKVRLELDKARGGK